MRKNDWNTWRPDLRSDRLGLSQWVYSHFQKNQMYSHVVLRNLWAEFQYLRNDCYVSTIMDTLCTFWFLFGSIWSRPDKVIRETNSIMQHIWLIFTGQIRRNKKKPVFVVVCIPFGYPDKYFHNFRIFSQTLVNI